MSLCAFSQSAHTFTSEIVPPGHTFEMPPLPDSLNDSEEKDAFQFAYPFPVSISKGNITPTIVDDTLVFEGAIHSEGAYSLNIIIDGFSIPDDAQFKITSTRTSAEQTITSGQIFAGTFASNIFQGDELRFRYAEPVSSKEKGRWTITQVAHDYKNVLKESSLKSTSADCNIDINCDAGADWQNEKHSVCKLLIQGTTLCTGTLIANTSKDNTPYVLTANHCVASDAKALRTVFWFDYEHISCEEKSTTSEKTLSGSTLVATSPDGKLDFSLLRLNRTPPKSYKPYYAGWNTADDVGKGTACIHHPRGDVKKISIDNEKPATQTFRTSGTNYAANAHWRIARWDAGTTEGGSSGASLFDNNHSIIGTLSGGEADCSSPTNDYFSKFSKAWNFYAANSARLQPWLDPTNTGASKCKGYDPYSIPGNIATNVSLYDTLLLYDFDGKIPGSWTGANEIGWSAFAERIITPKAIHAITLCGRIDTATARRDGLEFIVWKGEKSPQEPLATIPFTKDLIASATHIHIPLAAPLQSGSVYWVGYRIKNNSPAFSAFAANVSDEGTFFVRHPKGWVNTEELGFPAHAAVACAITTRPDTLHATPFEPPFFASRAIDSVAHLQTPELFGTDSLLTIRNSTTFYVVADKSDAPNFWAGPNESGGYCFANRIAIDKPTYIRGLKLAVAAIPSEQQETELAIWNADFTQKLTSRTITNDILAAGHFNQIHLDSLVRVDTTFAAGVCFDTVAYHENLTLYQYNATESSVESLFLTPGSWNSYADYGINYNLGIQPITAKSAFHHNLDSANVLRYPIPNTADKNIADRTGMTVFPSLARDYCHIQFKRHIFTEITATIFDQQGKLAKQCKAQLKGGRFTLPLRELPQGLYTIQVSAGGATYSGRFFRLAR